MKSVRILTQINGFCKLYLKKIVDRKLFLSKWIYKLGMHPVQGIQIYLESNPSIKMDTILTVLFYYFHLNGRPNKKKEKVIK